MKIAMVAGEMSGDILGAGLIAALRKRYPQARFQGIGGERMLAQGFESLFPLENLSVMGLVEVLRHLPTLMRIRLALNRHFNNDPPDVFIGIDSPDFNLPLERYLKHRAIPTVHYVSPTVWAWRRGRVHKIARSVDLMLTLFPFEADFYQDHSVPVHYVGHPLAYDIPLDNDEQAARRALDEVSDAPLFALLPGSRLSEVKALGGLFVETALWLSTQRPDSVFLMPVATERIRCHLSALIAERAPELRIKLVNGRSREIMAAADVILLASGTATLEALLLKRPMVVAYKMAPLTFFIVSQLVKIPYFSQPNLLAGRELVKEFIQKTATVDNLGPALLNLLDDRDRRKRLTMEFAKIHHWLRRNASDEAAAAIGKLLDKNMRRNASGFRSTLRS